MKRQEYVRNHNRAAEFCAACLEVRDDLGGGQYHLR
jgi:hypothetical protein